jgi:hypothetical protein
LPISDCGSTSGDGAAGAVCDEVAGPGDVRPVFQTVVSFDMAFPRF